VTATPPAYFPTTAALLGGRIVLDGAAMAAQPGLDAATLEIAAALRRGERVALDPGSGGGAALLPDRVRDSAAFRRDGTVPLAVAVHHGIGGVAIDAWGRTSLPGLYACGEAAGGVQGRRRMMGTGLIEARVFGLRAGGTAATDAAKRRESERGAAANTVMPPVPGRSGELEARLDGVLGPLVCARPAEDVCGAEAELSAWPLRAGAAGAGEGDFLAALRRAAALAILRAELAGDARDTGQLAGEVAGGAR
jgi:hypothetical protein